MGAVGTLHLDFAVADLNRAWQYLQWSFSSAQQKGRPGGSRAIRKVAASVGGQRGGTSDRKPWFSLLRQVLL